MNDSNMDVQRAVDLTDWLIERIAFYLDRPVDAIDPSVDLAIYGMDSLYAMSVISDIEDRLNLDIDTTTIRNYPTIKALGAHLEKLLAEKAPTAAPQPGDMS